MLFDAGQLTPREYVRVIALSTSYAYIIGPGCLERSFTSYHQNLSETLDKEKTLKSLPRQSYFLVLDLGL